VGITDAQEASDMRKALTGAALLAALTIIAAGCGGGDEPSGTATPAEPATTAAQETGGTTVAVANSKLGDILVDGDGRTLYVFTKDQGDKSACSGQCADNWPALVGDAKPGDTNGQGVGSVWYALTADGTLVKQKATGGAYP
jgi:predicted lipoprotein with Yx(FWY)xxD motif